MRRLALCFAVLTSPLLATKLVAADDELAQRFVVKKGIGLLVGTDLAATAQELAKATDLTLVIESPDADDVAKSRRALDRAGLLGIRVYVRQMSDRRLSLADNLASVVVADELTDELPTRAELLRVLNPRGKLLIGEDVEFKPVPEGSGDWTHPYHGSDNNPQSRDRIARAPFLTKFLAAPHYGPMPEITLSAGGRLFKAFGHLAFKKREWPMVGKLVAMNAYSGVIEWQRDMEPGFMIHRNTLVATADTLYLADHLSLKLIDTATGEIKEELRVPDSVSAEGPVWKWMTIRDGVLYALVGEKEELHTVHLGTRGQRGWPWSTVKSTYGNAQASWGFGRTLFALDLESRDVLWKRQEKDRVDSRAVAMSGERIFLYSHEKFLAAVDARNGQDVWRTENAELLEAIGEHDPADNPRLGYATSSYMKSTPGALFFAGPQRRQLVAVSAETGNLLWTYPTGNMQLIVRDDGLYAMGRMETSKKFDPLTGEILADLQCFRGNCTRATGTADSIFTRGYRHTGTMRFDVANKRPQRIPAMRPACQDGVIAANGQLYWGPWMCDCNHSLVGVISLTPAADFDFAQAATEEDNLERVGNVGAGAQLRVDPSRDWLTLRHDNRRTSSTTVDVHAKVDVHWRYQAKRDAIPTPAITYDEIVCFGGTDGIVRAMDGKSGSVRWTAYTDGRIYYPPTFSQGLVYVGSGDGHVHALDAASGETVWRFRAAPIERRIPVYGRLSSTWPVASGVLVEGGVAYAAAGIASHDGTRVYALDAKSGGIVWQNNNSSNLIEDSDEHAVTGVSVQGHLLFDDGKLYMAGGNVVSPAIYDASSGACLNELTGESPESLDTHWQKQRSSRGSELFLTEDGVVTAGRMLYTEKPDGISSRYNANYSLQAAREDLLIRGNAQTIQRLDPRKDENGRMKILWEHKWFTTTDAIVTAGNAVVIAGLMPDAAQDGEVVPAILSLNLDDGSVLWSHRLPHRVVKWGLAVDRHGGVIISLYNGDVVRLASK